MLRHIVYTSFCLVALLPLCSSSARGQAPEPIPLPKIPFQRPEVLPEEFRKELEKLQLEVQEAQREFGRGRFGGPATTASWGGARLQKVPDSLKEKLGLPENEGLLVATVDPDSRADKAGLRPKDVLVKISAKPVPSEIDALAKLVKDQKPDDPIELVVVRDGKEETIKGAAMPALVQATPAGRGGFPMRNPGPRLNLNGRLPNPIVPFPQGKIDNLILEMTVNGAKISRKQTADQFSGEYSKDDLKIRLTGKIEKGAPTVSEITIQEGRETTRFPRLADVPLQHRLLIQQLMPASNGILTLPMPGISLLPGRGLQILDFGDK